MNKQQQKEYILDSLKRNRDYFSQIPLLSDDEIKRRAEIATITAIELIALLNYMQAELRKSAEEFVNNYGNFSDYLNRIYDGSVNRAFDGGEVSPSAERFIERQRSEWGLLLPNTSRRLEKNNYEYNSAILFLFSVKRAERAARNNTNSLCNCGRLETLKRQGFKRKVWRTVMDGRERPTHAAANGQTVPIDQPFIVGGYKMMFPRDVTYGAPAQEIMNCRCSIEGV